ncbi:type VI secretion system contractile sheath large subunit [Pantoea jilinensis]|nr:type VI secretion system contractile sheath large subunit [Pantoea jilinensis]
MSVQNGSAAAGEGVVQERPAAGGIYASLFEKINLTPVAALSALDTWQDAQAMSEATADERLTAGMQVFLECLTRAGSKVEKLDKHLIDHHIAELDWQISRQLDAVMHHEAFQATESLWRGVKSLVDKTDFRQNVKIELLDMSKEDLRQDFEDSPEIIQSGLYKHTYIDEYDTPGGEPVAALISAYEFDASAQDVALLRSISKVSAAAHMPFIGSAGPKFFLKESMEEVAAIRDIGNYFDRAEYIKWKSFRETDDARVRMSLDTVPEQIVRLKARLTALALEEQALLDDIAAGSNRHGDRLGVIEQLRTELDVRIGEQEARFSSEKALAQQLIAGRQDISNQANISGLQQQLEQAQQGDVLVQVDVDTRTVANVIADWTGVPLSSLMKDEQAGLLTLENEMGRRVVGQDAPLHAIAQRLRAAKTGLTSENGPQGVFLLVGPSGVGKTETALALADVLYGGEKSLITINLSEYQEPHTVSQLKGSPPGYVGYGQGGILTEAVRKRPYSVILLDEVEKAHHDVMNLFYQVFDRGFMRDGEGREIDFRNTVILMTSNLGSDPLMQLLDEQPEATEGDLQELLHPILRDHFQPALLARFQTVIYRPLAEAAMRTIAEMKLSQVSRRLHRHYGLTTQIDESPAWNQREVSEHRLKR